VRVEYSEGTTNMRGSNEYIHDNNNPDTLLLPQHSTMRTTHGILTAHIAVCSNGFVTGLVDYWVATCTRVDMVEGNSK